MNQLLPFLLGFIAGALTTPALVHLYILRTREPYRRHDAYMDQEYGFAKAEMKIDEYLEDLTSDQSGDK